MSGQCKHCGHDGCVCDNDERTMNDTPTPKTDEWETYCDEWYYHMWRLRRKTERGWHDGFHIQKGDEAKGLCDILNNLETELTAVTEQRDQWKNKYIQQNKDLGHELRDSNETIWSECALANVRLTHKHNPNEL